MQQRVLEDLVAAGASAIMVSPVDAKNQTSGLDGIAAQVPLLTTDSDDPQSKRLAYIGSSNIALGQDAGKSMLKAMPNGGKCMGFVGLPGADNAKDRINGIKDTIKGTKVELIEFAPTKSTRAAPSATSKTPLPQPRTSPASLASTPTIPRASTRC